MNLNLTMLRHRALMLRSTVKVEKDCRQPLEEEVVLDGRTIKIRELAYYCNKGEWAADPKKLAATCNTPKCVVHLDFVATEDQDMQRVAHYVKSHPSLAEMFRKGRRKGWFKGASSYSA